MAASFVDQLKALLWRNYILKKRNKKQLFQELFFPVYLMLILVVVKVLNETQHYPAIESFPQHPLSDSRFHFNSSKKLLVSPNTSNVLNLMPTISSLLGNVSYEIFEDKFEAELAYKAKPEQVAAGVHFVDAKKIWNYTIRMAYESLPSASQMFINVQNEVQCHGSTDGTETGRECLANQYLTTGFVWLQTAIDTALIRQVDPSFSMPDVSVQLMPVDEYTPNISTIQIFSSIYIVMAYAVFINFLSINLVAEKEKKIREGMQMMGLRTSVWWLSWSLIYTVIILVVTGMIVIVLMAASFFANSNLFLLFIMLFLYGLSVINLAFVITPFFRKAQVAGLAASFFTILLSLLYLTVSLTRTPTSTGYHYSISPPGRWAFCLLSPVALALALDQGIFLDMIKGGMSFSTLTLGDFPLYAPITMLLVDIIIYFLLAVYLDHVIPGEYGPRYKPWFFMMPSYWSGNTTETGSTGNYQVSADLNTDFVELVPEDLSNKLGLRILNISKHFKGKKKTVMAVDELSLDIYEGQITALLGQNGAGKTTLINMLCGLSPPTSGTATIKGLSVSNSSDVEKIRSMTGVCPQHNILYDELTCEEHLLIFAGIKGVRKSQRADIVKKVLKDADIADQANVLAKRLSGGQKRKLSVAIALIGSPEILFLDEPSAGMDPYSRRHLWSHLKNNKEGKIILLTTHFMDEADILADRKAIISHGKLKCCGSSLFLKNRFGIGYHLNMVVEPHCDGNRVRDLLNLHVSGVQLKRTHAKELSFTLPLTEVTRFPAMFRELESPVGDGQSKAESLGISSYGVSMTSLEEVFLKIGEDEEVTHSETYINEMFEDDDDATKQHTTSTQIPEPQPNITMTLPPSQSRTDNVKITSQRFWALLKIRFLLKIRNKGAVIVQVFIPIILVIAGCLISKLKPNVDKSNPSSLEITPSCAVSETSPLLAVDSVGTPLSEEFIKQMTSNLPVDLVNSSVNISQLSHHWMGFNLFELHKNASSNYTALYNDTAIHSLPAVINLLSNGLLQLSTNSSGISVTSFVWPSVLTSVTYSSTSFIAALILVLAFLIVPPGFAMEIVKDRQIKARSQLRVSGISFNLYWSTCFFIHLIINLIPAIICVIIVISVNISVFSSGGAVLALLLVFFLNIPSNLLLSYICSFAFDKFETCQAFLPTIFFIAGLLPYIIVSKMDMFGQSSTAEILHYVFTLIDPPYIIAGGIYYIDRVSRIAGGLKERMSVDRYFKWTNNILITILVPIVHIGVLYFVLKIVDAHKSGVNISEILKCGDKNVKKIPEENTDVVEDEDDDVTEERRRVFHLEHTGNQRTPVCYVQNLRKEFKCREKAEDKVKVVVRNATFAVDAGEVLGLLGPNGAGKTTTLNMIIAETAATRGKIIVAGHSVQSSLSEAFQSLGYCPQHDALWDDITLKEHLECYAAIKGVAKQDIKSVINYYIQSLKLNEHVNKGAKTLSGGTKRKLSYAASMLGTSQIVLLDEPSTGMDPESKRFLWDTISSAFQSTGRGAILTTHNMEEADALCSRVAIMVNGQIKCLGPTQHLKDKFGSGYLLEIKLENKGHDLEEEQDKLEAHLTQLFPQIQCLDTFAERSQYRISKNDVKLLSKIFSSLEDLKNSHSVEEYSFSQSTLEQVFLEFAKKQHEGEMDEADMKNTSKTSLSKNRPETESVI